MLQAGNTQEVVKSIAHHRTGATTESRDSKGAYTTVMLVGEEDEVTHVEVFEGVLGERYRSDPYR